MPSVIEINRLLLRTPSAVVIFECMVFPSQFQTGVVILDVCGQYQVAVPGKRNQPVGHYYRSAPEREDLYGPANNRHGVVCWSAVINAFLGDFCLPSPCLKKILAPECLLTL